MAKSTRQYVFEGLELLPGALTPFVEKRLESGLAEGWQDRLAERMPALRFDRDGRIGWDQAALLNAMDWFWADAFKTVLGRAERAVVNELIAARNKLAHNEAFTYDDAERALDSMRRLAEAAGAGAAAGQLGAMRNAILRTKFAELQRNEERRQSRLPGIPGAAVGGLLPWREVVEPHEDVASGEFQQAEFAADLGKVHAGSAPAEYSDPREFFSRTYLTGGLRALLSGAAKRLSGAGGDPVVELQTNFGGGKTHSMLALYHMAGGTPADDLPGLDRLLAESGAAVPPRVSRAVLVGTARGPQDTIACEGGREIRTTWGEMAWQLGGADAFDRIADNDAKGVAPGSNLLEEVFRSCAPCLILIDEWVAYLRQIYKTDGLPAGSFDANLSFVQSLTEAVKTSPGTLLVAALPASQIEVGGEGGQEALARLKQTFSRIESSWRPATAEESYEIVRRRLFKDIPGDKFHHRDNTLKQYAKLYRDNANEFPRGCAEADYRRKLEKAYPIHPELFEQLYTGWGSLERFQRTRGVLRLMAQAVHELWMRGDSAAMIMPGGVEVGSSRVEPELLHYLEASWQSIVAGDVYGEGSIPYAIDRETPNLNRRAAAQRVARAVFMGTAPTHREENRGIDDKRIHLGVAQPGERPAVFGDALRRLSNRARFLHSDGGRYWYDSAPNLNRIAADRAAQVEEALVRVEIDKALAAYIGGLDGRGPFDAVQPAPGGSADVPDEAGGVRAVVLGVAHPHSDRGESEALKEAGDILLRKGAAPRVYRNALVFLAAEARQVANLEEAVRGALAWASIVRDKVRLDLTQSNTALAEEKQAEAERALKTRLREAWSRLLYPRQESAQAEVEWIAGKAPAQDGLLARAGKRLIEEEALLPVLGPARLDRDLQKYIWQGKNHLSLKDLWEYLNRCLYLPRLQNRAVLEKAVAAAVGGLAPGPFAYAEGWDEDAGAYRGLKIDGAANAPIVIDSESVIVKPDVAERHRPAPLPAGPGGAGVPGGGGPPPGDTDTGGGTRPDPPPLPGEAKPRRFSGAVMISPNRPAKEFGKIVESIVEQLTTLPGSAVTLKLEISAEVADGLDRAKVRTLIENANTLKFLDKEVK